MRTRLDLTFRALTRGAALVGLLTGCDQPAPRCSIARGEFSAIYTLKSGTGPCAELRGEVLGVQAYNAPQSASDPRPDYDRTSIGIQASTITGLLGGAQAAGVTGEADDLPYGLGAFRSARPDDDDLCSVPSLSVAHLRLPEIPEQVAACTTTPVQPAVDVSYTFSNVRVFTTAGAYGTQFSADLTYSRDGCTAEYTVVAVYPAVPCGIDPPTEDPGREAPAEDESDAGPDEAGEPVIDPETGEPCADDAAGPAQIADDTQCSATADPANGRPVGSGINVDFAIACDPALLLCVPTKAFPSLR